MYKDKYTALLRTVQAPGNTRLSRLESAHVRKALSNLDKAAIKRLGDAAYERWQVSLETFGYRSAALDWFDEQAQSPDLMRRRGLRPGQPLPKTLGIFDDTGRIREQLPRESVVRLREWLADDDAVLAWFFPEGLSADDDKDLRNQLDTLHHYERPDGGHGQPWSPIAALDAVLADWPQNQPTREVTLAAAERDLIAVLDELFPDKIPRPDGA